MIAQLQTSHICFFADQGWSTNPLSRIKQRNSNFSSSLDSSDRWKSVCSSFQTSARISESWSPMSLPTFHFSPWTRKPQITRLWRQILLTFAWVWIQAPEQRRKRKKKTDVFGFRISASPLFFCVSLSFLSAAAMQLPWMWDTCTDRKLPVFFGIYHLCVSRLQTSLIQYQRCKWALESSKTYIIKCCFPDETLSDAWTFRCMLTILFFPPQVHIRTDTGKDTKRTKKNFFKNAGDVRQAGDLLRMRLKKFLSVTLRAFYGTCHTAHYLEGQNYRAAETRKFPGASKWKESWREWGGNSTQPPNHCTGSTLNLRFKTGPYPAVWRPMGSQRLSSGRWSFKRQKQKHPFSLSWLFSGNHSNSNLRMFEAFCC